MDVFKNVKSIGNKITSGNVKIFLFYRTRYVHFYEQKTNSAVFILI